MLVSKGGSKLWNHNNGARLSPFMAFPSQAITRHPLIVMFAGSKTKSQASASTGAFMNVTDIGSQQTKAFCHWDGKHTMKPVKRRCWRIDAWVECSSTTSSSSSSSSSGSGSGSSSSNSSSSFCCCCCCRGPPLSRPLSPPLKSPLSHPLSPPPSAPS